MDPICLQLIATTIQGTSKSEVAGEGKTFVCGCILIPIHTALDPDGTHVLSNDSHDSGVYFTLSAVKRNGFSSTYWRCLCSQASLSGSTHF